MLASLPFSILRALRQSTPPDLAAATGQHAVDESATGDLRRVDLDGVLKHTLTRDQSVVALPLGGQDVCLAELIEDAREPRDELDGLQTGVHADPVRVACDELFRIRQVPVRSNLATQVVEEVTAARARVEVLDGARSARFVEFPVH